MVKHIILWKLSEELSAEEKEKVKAGIKEGLEGLVGKVPGLLECKVNISGRLDSSNCDVMLDSTLESPEALKGYAFQIEMKFTAYKIGFKIKEVPVIFVNRREGVSKMNGGIFGEAFFGVMRLRLDGWIRKYPALPKA